VLKLRISPEIRHRRSLRRLSSGGSIDVVVNGEATSVRPGSWSGAKAQEGSPEDLRDPIGVHTKQPEMRAAGTQGPGGSLHPSRSATANTKQEDRVGSRSETNKQLLIRKWEVVALS
jgi:hypothetical protein